MQQGFFLIKTNPQERNPEMPAYTEITMVIPCTEVHHHVYVDVAADDFVMRKPAHIRALSI